MFRSLSWPVMVCVLGLAGCAASGDSVTTSDMPESGAMASPSDEMGAFPMPAPGPEHAMLAARAGEWRVNTRMRMAPDQPWAESESLETAEMAAGGFWLVAVQRGSMMGMPFEGRSSLGYDQYRQKYVGTWIDNFGSYLTTYEGDYDAGSHTMTMFANMLDPMSGKTMRTKMITRDMSEDSAVFEMHMPQEDGTYYMSMEARYTRIR